MNYVLGIDSGGSKFLIKAASLSNEILAIYEGEPSGFRFSSLEQGIQDVNEQIKQCLQQFNGLRSQCRAIVCGSTGIDSIGDHQRIKQVYENLGGFSCLIHCVNDAEVALHAATGGIGVIVISGTGSVAFGRNSQGETSRSGGWWFSMGADEGSGTFIALRALQHGGAYLDKRRPEDDLIRLLRNQLGIKRREDLIGLGRGPVSHWSKLKIPKLVDEAAATGCTEALSILEEAAEHTYQLGDSVVKKLQLDREDCFRVGAWGSAIAKSPIHFQLFKEKFLHTYPDAKVTLPVKDAAVGAVAMALEMISKDGQQGNLK